MAITPRKEGFAAEDAQIPGMRPGRGSPQTKEPSRDRDDFESMVKVASLSVHSSRWDRDNARASFTADLNTIIKDDPRLDPSGSSFDFILWARKFMHLMMEEGHQLRKTGFCVQNLGISGSGAALKVQKTVASILPSPSSLKRLDKSQKRILNNINASIGSGEMLLVLGRPGAGCTTLLKTVCGQTHGLHLTAGSQITYDGVAQKTFLEQFRGEVIYNQETEKHFPHLTVGQTLEFSAGCRTPSKRLLGATRQQFAQHMTTVVMRIFGLSHTRNTKVGNDFVRGVSGGERKRVSIAEMVLAGPSIAAWDNSTRGLDSATALEFIKSLRTASDVANLTHLVAAYQASQSMYDLFDKVILLYEGRQIYFGPAASAREFFVNMGYECPSRQTTGDFLTSVTNPGERTARKGFEASVPRTAAEFEQYWHQSKQFEACQLAISRLESRFGNGQQNLDTFRQSHSEHQAKHTRTKSPYMISVPMQIQLCTKRAYQRLWNDKASTISTIAGQIIQALVVGSIFYGPSNTTASFYSKGSAAFVAILLSALQSIVEINTLYEQRPIVSKHRSYAFYHPWTEAAAGIVADIPVKLVANGCFLVILYFLAGLKDTAAAFFTFFLFCFVAMLTMSMIFRTTAAATKSDSQAFAIAGILVLWIAVYTGFAIQRPYMKPWFKWSSWLNPVSYAYESLLVNEVHDRSFPCAPTSIIPPYGIGNNYACAIAGAVAGETLVSGDAWVETSYGYSYSHIWRNLGILIAFFGFFLALYLLATEMNSHSGSTAEQLVFRKGHEPAVARQIQCKDEEIALDDVQAGHSDHSDFDTEQSPHAHELITAQKGILTWDELTLDVKIKDETRRLLDGVSGWVKPGTLTALMGTSGAGKTTLLDTLSQRISIGVVSGDTLVNGKPLGSSFQREIGYVQQQDLHLETTTVREALQFSAMLRQPKSVPTEEKMDYVENVIKLLRMEAFAEAVVGVPGEGLNVEQRKLLSIGVEIAAKPALLLFLDEPTSGLDSQSSWGIISILRDLANSGQAILCTIHQPSALLFQQFDRLLFLARGGKTVYFGSVGEQSRTVLDYFEAHGARTCGSDENPAEYLLEVVGQNKKQDWNTTWKASNEATALQCDLQKLHESSRQDDTVGEIQSATEYAMPLTSQIYYVTRRVFSQYWRTPTYIQGKFMLVIGAALFIGFTFYKQPSTQAGLQNTIFAIFMLTAVFSSLVQQIMPRLVIQRSLYEVRERPSKVYSWVAFLFANIVVELPYQIVLAVMAWASWYFPVFGKDNSTQENGLMLLFVIEFLLFASTFSQMVIVALPDASTAGNVATLLFSMMITFSGVLQSPDALPGFWIFMYRVSPLTYLIGGWAGTSISQRAVQCATSEFAIFDPPAGQTCAQYLQPYFQEGAIGYLQEPQATSNCHYCSISTGAQYLSGSRIYASDRWRDFGLIWVYILFNIGATILLYYFFRVRKLSIHLLTAFKRSRKARA